MFEHICSIAILNKDLVEMAWRWWCVVEIDGIATISITVIEQPNISLVTEQHVSHAFFFQAMFLQLVVSLIYFLQRLIAYCVVHALVIDFVSLENKIVWHFFPIVRSFISAWTQLSIFSSKCTWCMFVS